jgi:hypothetical protein
MTLPDYPRHVWASEIHPGLAKYVDIAIQHEEKYSSYESPCAETFRGHLQNLITAAQNRTWRLPRGVTQKEMIKHLQLQIERLDWLEMAEAEGLDVR